MFPQDHAFVKEGSIEVSSTQCLKLFGKTVLVTDPCRPSSPTPGASKVQPSDHNNDEKTSLTLAWDSQPKKVNLCASKCSPNALPWGVPSPSFVCSLTQQNECPNRVEISHCHSLPWLTRQGNQYSPLVQVHNPIPVKAQPLLDTVRSCKPGSSSTGSGIESESGEVHKDMEAKSSQSLLEEDVEKNECIQQSSSKHGTKPFFKHRATSSKRAKGFVPYKRCLAERDSCSVITGEEREEQRIRLCL